MSPEGVDIFRLVLAGLNGALFAFGVVLLLEMIWLRPRRWRRSITRHVDAAERARLRGDTDEEAKHREAIDGIKRLVRDHYQNPRSALTIGFGLLILAVSIMALLALLNPPAGPFLD